MSRYVSGDRDPKPEVLANIATALHTTSDYLLGIENEEFSHPRIRRMIARNASAMTEQEKRELINALFGEE
jgi:transcriptional regulator with XRE-family HTH domain